MTSVRLCIAALLLMAASSVLAQESIVIGGQVVARIRHKGRFESVAARVAQIDKWIADVISYENTQNPRLSLARKNGILHIYVANRPIIDIYPADAAALNTTEMALARSWLKNIKAALPKATPVSRLPARPTTAETRPPTIPIIPVAPESGAVRNTGTAAPVVATEAVTEASPVSPDASRTPTGDIVPPEPEEALPQPKKTPRSAALLMILEAMNVARALTEQEYLEGRDRLAANLLENLEPFMTEARAEGEAAGQPEPPRPPLIQTTAPTPPSVSTESERPAPPAGQLPPATGTGGAVVPRVPTVPSGPSVPQSPSGATVKPATATGKTGDPSMARVPQKQRIKRKFDAAAKPFYDLKNAGDPTAAQVEELLRAARAAHTQGDFDASEAKVDEALRLMGVPIPQ